MPYILGDWFDKMGFSIWLDNLDFVVDMCNVTLCQMLLWLILGSKLSTRLERRQEKTRRNQGKETCCNIILFPPRRLYLLRQSVCIGTLHGITPFCFARLILFGLSHAKHRY